MNEHLPACCQYDDRSPIAKRLYATYNAAGDKKGLNFAGNPCPTWEELPTDIRTKWEAVATAVYPQVVIAGVVGSINMGG